MLKKERKRESEFPFSSASHENSLFIRASKLTWQCYDHFKEWGEYKQKYTERQRGKNKDALCLPRQLKALVCMCQT